MDQLFSFIPEYGATVVFVFFLVLWHRRTSARDVMYHETQRETMAALMACMSKLTAENRD